MKTNLFRDGPVALATCGLSLALAACDGDPSGPDGPFAYEITEIHVANRGPMGASDINEDGAVVGIYPSPNGHWATPFYWYAGEFRDIQSEVAIPLASANAMNEDHEVAVASGHFDNPCPGGLQGLIWRPDGPSTEIGCGQPRDILDDGTVLLNHWATWKDGVETKLDEPEYLRGQGQRLSHFNERGEISFVRSPDPACNNVISAHILRSDGTDENFGCTYSALDLSATGWAAGYAPFGGIIVSPVETIIIPVAEFAAHAVNDNGVVAGMGPDGPMLWIDGELEPVALPETQWVVGGVSAINNRREMVVSASVRNPDDTLTHAILLLTPVES